MYQDAKYIIQYCRDSVTRAKNAMQEDNNVIRIGSSPITPAQLLMDLWSKVQTLYPDIKFQIVPFENLLLMHRDWSHYVDQLRDDLWQNHPQIHIVDFDFYGMDVFNRCENTNAVLLAVPGWANVHPLLKVLPVEWDHCIPYGLLHSPKPTPTVQHFLDAAKAVSRELYGS